MALRASSAPDEAERAKLAAIPSELLGPEEIRRLHGVDFAIAVDRRGIEKAVTTGDFSLERIGQAFGASARTIRYWAKKESWVRARPTKSLRRGRHRRELGDKRPTKPSAGKLGRRQMLQRLYAALDLKLKLLEERMSQAGLPDGVPPSAAELERGLRALSTATRLFAKLEELETAAKRKGESTRSSPGGERDDAEQLRRDLALRLERLNQARDA